MLRKVVDNTKVPSPDGRAGLNWYRLKLRALAAQRAASPYIRGPILFALGAVFYLAFLLLLWLRPLVQALLRIIAGLTLLALLIGAFVIPEQHRHVLWAIGGASFAAFLVSWFYDWILLRIAPEPVAFFD